jgi:hypothetical protein
MIWAGDDGWLLCSKVASGGATRRFSDRGEGVKRSHREVLKLPAGSSWSNDLLSGGMASVATS